MNCVAKFFPFGCEFQNLLSERTIGNAKECDGLYFLEDKQVILNKQAQALSGESVSDFISNQIMLWHNRLSHPNFSYL